MNFFPFRYFANPFLRLFSFFSGACVFYCLPFGTGLRDDANFLPRCSVQLSAYSSVLQVGSRVVSWVATLLADIENQSARLIFLNIRPRWSVTFRPLSFNFAAYAKYSRMAVVWRSRGPVWRGPGNCTTGSYRHTISWSGAGGLIMSGPEDFSCLSSRKQRRELKCTFHPMMTSSLTNRWEV